jgi:hypothetical protein
MTRINLIWAPAQPEVGMIKRLDFWAALFTVTMSLLWLIHDIASFSPHPFKGEPTTRPQSIMINFALLSLGIYYIYLIKKAKK